MFKLYSSLPVAAFAIYRGAQIYGVPNAYLTIGLLASTAITILTAVYSRSVVYSMYKHSIRATSLCGEITIIEENGENNEEVGENPKKNRDYKNDLELVSELISDLIDNNNIQDIFSSKFDYSKTPIYIYESNTPNAFACGWSKNDSAIYVSTEILDRLRNRPQELKAVLAHEMGHIAGKHIMIKTFASTIQILAHTMKETAKHIIMYDSHHKSKNDTDDKNAASKVAALLAYVGLFIVDAFLLSTVSRQLEYDADQVAVKCGLGSELINALDKISHGHETYGLWSFLTETFSSHPTDLNRALAIEFSIKSKDMKWPEYIKEYFNYSVKEWTSAFSTETTESVLSNLAARAA